ncbi:hypothetical protein [Alkaliphilus transvaalensis]|uniref:hypothetical protein n=1 Tax=Alkaliphilus transvaalensis TaxID=114628 RepID=UPI00047E4F80|nr:hypothetical protein [Alkaliphilus transvaalensis]
MSIWSMIFFLLAVFYFVGGIFEFPIMFEGNPKTRLLMSKMGKKNLKIMIYLFAVAFTILAFMLR